MTPEEMKQLNDLYQKWGAIQLSKILVRLEGGDLDKADIQTLTAVSCLTHNLNAIGDYIHIEAELCQPKTN